MLLAALLGAAGCGGDRGAPLAQERGDWLLEATRAPEFREACEELEHCRQPLYPAPGRTERVWRVRIVRAVGGAIRIAEVEAIEVPEGDGVPVGPLGGDHVLVALDDAGAALDGQRLRFPANLRLELVGARASQRVVDLSTRTVDAVAHVRAAPRVERLVVEDAAGEVVASSVVPAPVAASNEPPDLPWGIAAPAFASSNATTGLPPYCSHVVVLNGEADRHLASNLAFDVLPQVVKEMAAEHAAAVGELTGLDPADLQPTLVSPGAHQLAAVVSALGRMTPLLCQSIGRIAFASFPVMKDHAAGAVFQAGGGDLIMINTASGFDEDTLRASPVSQWVLQSTLLHEAGHCAEALLNAEAVDSMVYAGEWRSQDRALAAKTIDHVRMRGGFGAEWRRVHDAFVAQGWARPYDESGLVTGRFMELGRDEVVRGGFMDNYGANVWWDDIAEFVRGVYVTKEIAEGGVAEELRTDKACALMQAHGDRNVPASLAAVYTKLVFVRDLGLVPPGLADYCAGPHLGLPATAPGFDPPLVLRFLLER